MQTKQDNSIRKAAVFVQSLDHEAAETLYARLSYEEAMQLRSAVQELGTVQENEHKEVVEALRHQKSILSESQAVAPASQSVYDDRDGVALEIGSGAYDAPVKVKPTTPILTEEPADWFACLSEAVPAGIAGYLASEQPRAIALVLSYVTPDLAASILAEFPEDQQTKVLLQLASLGEADPASVRVLATGLSTWIKRQQQVVEVRANRLSSVKAIVAATPKSRRESLVNSLQESDHQNFTDLEVLKEKVLQENVVSNSATIENNLVAKTSYPRLHEPNESEVNKSERLAVESNESPTSYQPAYGASLLSSQPTRPKPLLSYADLDRLDERTLSQALTKLTPRTALLALVEASDVVLKRIESKLSRRSAQEFRQRLIQLGPTSLADIDHAKEEFLLAAERIVRQRRIASMKQSNK